MLEISSGFLSIPTDDWSELVKLTKSIGLKPKPEVGILFGAGGDTEGLENKGTRDPRWVIEVRLSLQYALLISNPETLQRAENFLEAGADRIMVKPLFADHLERARLIKYPVQIESEGITENVKTWRTDVVSALTAALPVDKLMFEAAEPAVFA